jgi:hypothetical protein
LKVGSKKEVCKKRRADEPMKGRFAQCQHKSEEFVAIQGVFMAGAIG